MKQTAVVWLQKSLSLTYEQQMQFEGLFQQANAMFEEQIKLAFTQGELFSGDFYDPNNPKVDCSENYYNETYNQ
jgi:hypothetical protein